jgi:hypothetical protein
MIHVLKAYRFLNLLSIDVAVGAVCCALFLAKILHVHILPYVLLSLALTVWIIYTADHLVDARKIKGKASTDRHAFHQQHHHFLFKALIAASLLDGLLMFFISGQVLAGGIVLATGVGMYLLVQRHIPYLKELVIAVFYTGGVLLPSITVTNIPISQLPWIVITQFFLVALSNLLIFSWFDYEKDVRDNTTSFVTIVGKQKSSVCVWLLTGGVVVLTFFSTLLLASSFLTLITGVLLLIRTQPQWFAENDRFRLIGDGLLMLPVLYLLF